MPKGTGAEIMLTLAVPQNLATTVAGYASRVWGNIDRNCGVPRGFKWLCQLGVSKDGERIFSRSQSQTSLHFSIHITRTT